MFDISDASEDFRPIPVPGVSMPRDIRRGLPAYPLADFLRLKPVQFCSSVSPRRLDKLRQSIGQFAVPRYIAPRLPANRVELAHVADLVQGENQLLLALHVVRFTCRQLFANRRRRGICVQPFRCFPRWVFLQTGRPHEICSRSGGV